MLRKGISHSAIDRAIMIPKVIHYCWFGHGEKPELAKKCIESWKKFCPDFEIREWNEETYDVKCHPYAKFCADNKKWAFLSDYVRLDVVARFGGIYLDTDVEVVRSLEPLLKYQAFYGFENAQYVATGLGFGAEAGHPTVVAMRGAYDHLQNRDGTICVTGCPTLNTNALRSLGLVRNGQRQNVLGAEILPIDSLNPYEDATGMLHITEQTYSIHWYAKSALPVSARIRSKLTRPFHRVFGRDCFQKIKHHRR